MSDWTPGPWRFRETGRKTFGPDGCFVIERDAPDGEISTLIAMPHSATTGKAAKESIANGRLMAAAPDMAEALERLTCETEAALRAAFGDGPPGDRIEDQPCLVRARKALAKAYGKEPYQ